MGDFYIVFAEMDLSAILAGGVHAHITEESEGMFMQK